MAREETRGQGEGKSSKRHKRRGLNRKKQMARRRNGNMSENSTRPSNLQRSNHSLDAVCASAFLLRGFTLGFGHSGSGDLNSTSAMVGRLRY